MKTGREGFNENGVFTISGLMPEKLTHEAMHGYLTKGRRLHSAYVCTFFIRLLRLHYTVPVQTARWISTTIKRTRTALAERFQRGTAPCRQE
jgi:hypothetical protein